MVTGNPVFCILALSAYLNFCERHNISNRQFGDGISDKNLKDIPPFLQTKCVNNLDVNTPNEFFHRTQNIQLDLKTLIKIWKSKFKPQLLDNFIKKLVKVSANLANSRKISKKLENPSTLEHSETEGQSSIPVNNNIIPAHNYGPKSPKSEAVPANKGLKSNFLIGNFLNRVDSNSRGPEMPDSSKNSIISFPDAPNLIRNNDILNRRIDSPYPIARDWSNDAPFNPLDPRFQDPYGGNWVDDDGLGNKNSGRDIELGAVLGKFWGKTVGTNNRVSDGSFLRCYDLCEFRDQNADCRLDLKCLQKLSFEAYSQFSPLY